MDKIRQYYKINDIKPKYHELLMPFYKTNPAKIDINLREIELYYNKHLDMYEEKNIKGGEEKINTKPSPIVIMEIEF